MTDAPRVTPEPFETLYRSPGLIIINKPAGLAVHPGPSRRPSVEDWFPLMSRRKDGPWLAHRLDADTAGCLAIALRKQALLDAQSCFAAGRAEKTYWAIVSGVPAEHGEMTQPIAKRQDRSGWRMVVDAAGQPARTQWTRIGTNGVYSWLSLRLLSGRTHQARLHCAASGFPILGDPIYGDAGSGTGLHLLARHLALPMTVAAEATAPPPDHMQHALHACGWQPD